MENDVKQSKISSREKVYDFIVEFIKKNGYSPSIKEIGIGTGLRSTSSVYNHLMKLKLMGKIDMKENTPRTISVTGYKFVGEGMLRTGK